MTAEAIAYRVSCFEALGYFVAPMTREQRRARLVTFKKALDDIPAPFSAGAFEEWFQRMSRAPTPGDIRNGGKRLWASAAERLERYRRDTAPPKRYELTDEEIERRRAFARQMEAEFPGLLKGDA